jgi:hypothetical protein
MQEPYKKGVANHRGPESCAEGREATSEALAGENAGQPLSSEITPTGMPTLWQRSGTFLGSTERCPSALSVWRAD